MATTLLDDTVGVSTAVSVMSVVQSERQFQNMGSVGCGASKLQQMLKVLAARPGFDRAVRQVSRR